MQSAGRLKSLERNEKFWQTAQKFCRRTIECYAIQFQEISQQKNIINSRKLGQEEKILVQKEIHNILKKATAKTQNHLEGEFITNFSAIYQDGRGVPTSNKLETPKSVYTLPALQDRELSLSR